MSTIYDPNHEATNEEKVIAGHWECLRRNKKFRAISARWLKSEKFRRSHALSLNYHDMQQHTPRCAWDWMLTADQRVSLGKFQLEKLRWFFDNDFNFGPIICRQNFSPVYAGSKNWLHFLKVEPMPNPPTPITVDQAWDSTPEMFKKQFRLAYRPPHEFEEVNARLAEHVMPLRMAAKKLAAGDPLKEMPVIAHYLFTLANELRDLAEFFKVFKIPKSRQSEKQFTLLLGKIHESFKASNLLLPTKTYDRNKSYQGTDEDWHWYLEAERLGLDISKSADCYKLAEIYSHLLRQRVMRGNAPRRAKSHGHSGSKIPSKVIKGRRSIVKRHVRAIERWVEAAYPPQKNDASMSVS